MEYRRPDSDKFLVRDDGANAPVVHQRIIARLTARLYPLYESERIFYEPLPGMMVGEYSSPTPDVTLYDNATDLTVVVIEICQTRGVKSDVEKVVRMIDGGLYGIQEGFVHDYRTGHWFRYRKGDSGLKTESSFSDILQLDLKSFL
jgi:Uma2 family endonuclease